MKAQKESQKIENPDIPSDIANEEFLYRGIIESQWDYKKNQPSSAVFKDSKGASVDRDYDRPESECIRALMGRRNFFGICKVQTLKVRENNAIVKYLPDQESNPYHCEIHDSETRAQLRGSKPKKIRDLSSIVYLNAGE